jgi:glutaminase
VPIFFVSSQGSKLIQMNYQEILENIYQEILPYAQNGKQADYIPALAKVNPDQFGMCLDTVEGETFAIQDSQTRFSIQSISKVFAVALALSMKGEMLWKQVGKEPSGNAFNSLFQLELEKGFARNPFINAGAIVVADILLDELEDPENDFLKFVRTLCGNGSIDYNMEVATSERETGYMNAAIANLLKYHGRIKNNIEDVLMFYFKMCSVEMSCEELSKAFLAFTGYKPFEYCGFKLTSSQVKRLNAVMQTCGFYDEAGEFSYLVGLPGKSGVGGGIIAIYPHKYSVAVWSPRLNSKGNSIMGLKALELLTTYTAESIF